MQRWNLTDKQKNAIVFSVNRLKRKKRAKPLFSFLLPEMVSSCSRSFKHETAMVSYSHIFFSCLPSSASFSFALSLQPFPQLCHSGQEMEMEALMKFLLLLPRPMVSSGILETFLELLNAGKRIIFLVVLMLPNRTRISLYVLQGKKPTLTLCFSVCVYVFI